MRLAEPVASFVVIFLLMVVVSLWLRKRGVLSPAQTPLISGIITEGVLPAMIFCYVARSSEQPALLELAALIAIAEAMACAVSALVGRFILRLDRRSLGSFVLASSFGSTSLIGNALLDVVFHGSAVVLGMGMVVGQFGVGVPNNTVGLWIGMHAGDKPPSQAARPDRFAIFKTPVMIAVVGGVAWNLCGLPTTRPGISSVFGALTLVAAALPFLAAMITGMSMAPIDWRHLAPEIAISQTLQLVLKPLFVLGVMSVLPLVALDREVTLLLSALPASPLAVAFASRYGGDTHLATALVVSSTVISVVTLPLISWLS
jgi:predicted permease